MDRVAEVASLAQGDLGGWAEKVKATERGLQEELEIVEVEATVDAMAAFAVVVGRGRVGEVEVRDSATEAVMVRQIPQCLCQLLKPPQQ